ncbi:MAG: flagellar basal body rod protein FlgB [Eubacterium sp.]|jgi:flagellar basal-body rod protein FlgB|nr:flagellar basal body rod protein FlgB [Eubacterium sp.]
MAGLFNTTAFRLTEQGMKLMVEQNKIISHNIANQDTPDYKCKYLYFEGVLREKQKLRQGEKYKLELNMASAVYEDENTKDQPSGNNVDNDTQQALFIKNELMYETLKNQMDSEFNLMRTALRRN